MRIKYPGAYYHVMNRGNRREDIFINETDRSSFVAALSDSCEAFSVKLIAYVLMANHFHLLVQTAHGNLSEFMRHFLVTYTVRFNRRHGRSGHVFQGRFKSFLVEEDQYLLPLSRYMHLNPIRPRRFRDADIQSKSDYLKKYRWSTYPGYCYLRKRDKNIDYGWLLNTYFGEDSAQGRRRYRAYVQQGIEGEIENPFEEVVHQSILGSQSFVKWVKKKLPRRQPREIPSLGKLQHDIAVEHIIKEVARACQVRTEDLLDRKTRRKELRQMAMELSYRYSNEKQAAIGAVFGVDYSTVSQSRARLKAKLESSRKLNKQFDEIKEQVINLSI
ncbi:MAG: transposase [Desulfobacterales bacterium]|nr:MAG: transposase [Desulfobacterales bacterium]